MIVFDARRAQVLFCFGSLVVHVISIGEYKQEFGVEAVRALIHGDSFQRAA